MYARDDNPHLFLSLGMMISLIFVFGCFYLHHLTGSFQPFQLSHERVGVICDSSHSDLDDGHDSEQDYALIAFHSGGFGSAPEIETQPVCQADPHLSISPLLPPPRFG